MMCTAALLWNWFLLWTYSFMPMLFLEWMLFLINIDISFVTNYQWLTYSLLLTLLTGSIAVTSLGDYISQNLLQTRDLYDHEYFIPLTESLATLIDKINFHKSILLKTNDELIPWAFTLGQNTIVVTQGALRLCTKEEMELLLLQALVSIKKQYAIKIAFIHGTRWIPELINKCICKLIDLVNSLSIYFKVFMIVKVPIQVLKWWFDGVTYAWEVIFNAYIKHIIYKVDYELVLMGYKDILLSYLMKLETMTISEDSVSCYNRANISLRIYRIKKQELSFSF